MERSHAQLPGGAATRMPSPHRPNPAPPSHPQVRNFPSSRGSVVGVLKAGIGLSGSLFASVYTGVFFLDKASRVEAGRGR